MVSDNIKMDLKDTEWEGMNLVIMIQNRGQLQVLVNTVMVL
jgi:hypothetical protein